jgi:hypothetical protein
MPCQIFRMGYQHFERRRLHCNVAYYCLVWGKGSQRPFLIHQIRPSYVTGTFPADMRDVDRASLDDLQGEAVAAICEVMLVPNELCRRGREGASRSWTQRHEGNVDARATAKPVALVADAIRDASHRGGIVLDPFGGAGSTLIAAQKTDRRARLIELEPRYVDATIKRWEALTGKKVIHAVTGLAFGAKDKEDRDEAEASASIQSAAQGARR